MNGVDGRSSGPGPVARPRGRGGLRTRIVLGFGSVTLLTAFLTMIITSFVLLAIISYHYGFVASVAHAVFGVTPRVSDTDAFVILIAGALLVIAITVGVALVVARRVLQPVGQLADAADRVAAGDLDVQLVPAGQDELAALVVTFNAMTARVRDSVEELRRHEAQARRFASDVSHELRSPLAAMTAVTEVLAEYADTRAEPEARATRLLISGVTRLEGLVEDLIEISRFDAGTAQLQLDTIDVADAVSGCLAMRDWTAVVSVEVPAGLRVTVDRRRFDVIVANLVGNALAHGGAPVQLAVTVSPAVSGSPELQLSVRDHGPGLAPEVLPAVFDRFFKADTARAPSAGSGLGLAIAQENARLHGGQITAANARPSGAVFTLSLPVAGPPAADGRP